jgi:hypothetical protein
VAVLMTLAHTPFALRSELALTEPSRFCTPEISLSPESAPVPELP